MAQYLKKRPRAYYPINIAHTESIAEAFRDEITSGLVIPVVSSKDTIPLPAGALDVVISENCFEHLECYEEMMAELHRVLRPEGHVMAVFSPLYFSPYGAHFHEVTKLPYVHLLGSQVTLQRWIQEEMVRQGSDEHFGYVWNQYATLNRLKPSDFLRPFCDSSKWQLERCETFPFRSSNKYPGRFAEWLTHGIRLAARKQG